MRVTYTWTEPEWRKAVALASSREQRRPVLPGLTIALVMLPLIGGVIEFIINIRRTGRFTLAGTILPLLLILVAVVVALLALVAYLSSHRNLKALQATMPTGQWEAALHEAGWRFTRADEAISNHAALALSPWSDLAELRHGDNVIVLLHPEGFHAIPMTGLTSEQSSHLYRLVTRKLRPAPAH